MTVAILHPTDFSPGADQALAVALRLARALGAEVVLLHALAPADADEWLTDAERARLREGRRRRAEENLERRVLEAHRRGLRVKGLLRAGQPVEEIARAADDERADLVVMGTHGRGGLARLFLGSVAEGVIRCAPCPVVTVRGAAAPPEPVRPASPPAAAPG